MILLENANVLAARAHADAFANAYPDDGATADAHADNGPSPILGDRDTFALVFHDRACAKRHRESSHRPPSAKAEFSRPAVTYFRMSSNRCASVCAYISH